MFAKRKMIATELRSTEEAYLHNLSIVCSVCSVLCAIDHNSYGMVQICGSIKLRACKIE
jgi:hypothetical protein